MTHKFKPGETIRIVSRAYGTSTQGNFQIVRLLPAERGVCQYRVRSTVDGRERVVLEDEVA